MTLLFDQKFSFVSMAEPGNAFSVVRFHGTEGLNTLFEFNIELVSEKDDVDLTEILENPATFSILRTEGDVPFSGILKHFEQKHKVGKAVFYHAVLVPKLWWLSLTYHNQVFLKQSTPDILEAVLLDGGLLPSDFEFRLQKSYPEWDYVCQYNETHYNFFLRWLERDGLYYYFDQSSGKSRLVITDTRISHENMPQGGHVRYVQPTGMEHRHTGEIAYDFSLRQQMVPKQIRLKDYNYRTPSLDLQGEAEVAEYGRGTFFHYGEHFGTPSEGDALAEVRAESYKCLEKRFYGKSGVPYIRPGFIFTLERHYREDFNQNYMTVEMEHMGNQAGFFIAGLGLEGEKSDHKFHYSNTFMAIPSKVQFRGLLQTPKPRISGSMNAWVDGSGTGTYAEVDDQGRYKIKLPFDLVTREGGEASAWVRMAQPYSGSNHGMHFPLHKGTEVLLTFIDGDPDRPIIQNAVPNPDTPSQITQDDQTMCKITTGGQNKIHMEDKEGSQRILLHTPTQNSFVRIGAHNDPAPSTATDVGDWLLDKGKTLATNPDGISLYSSGLLKVSVEAQTELILGMSNKMILGMYTSGCVGMTNKITVGRQFEFKYGGHWTFSPKWVNLRAAKESAHAEKEEATGERSEEVGSHEEVVGEQDEMHGERNVMDGELVVMAGERSGMFGENEQMFGESTLMAGELTLLCGEMTQLIGEATNLVGEQTDLIGERTALLGEETVLAGESTELVGEKTMLAGELNILAGMVMML